MHGKGRAITGAQPTHEGKAGAGAVAEAVPVDQDFTPLGHSRRGRNGLCPLLRWQARARAARLRDAATRTWNAARPTITRQIREARHRRTPHRAHDRLGCCRRRLGKAPRCLRLRPAARRPGLLDPRVRRRGRHRRDAADPREPRQMERRRAGRARVSERFDRRALGPVQLLHHARWRRRSISTRPRGAEKLLRQAHTHRRRPVPHQFS